MSIRDGMPWWGVVGMKLALSQLPVSYKTWRRLGIFNFGAMDNPDYAWEVFERHFSQYRRAHSNPRGFSTLEIGPGCSLFTALISRALGGENCYLVDAVRAAEEDIALYRNMAAFLEKKGLPALPIANAGTLDEVLSAVSARYYTDALTSLRQIPDRSADFIFSQVVIQSIPLADFEPAMRELRRIIRPGGICSHHVEMKDLIKNSLHNLRFPERVWHTRTFIRSGFYSNRIRYAQMLDIFRRCGFECETVEVTRWPELPLPVEKMQPEFAKIPVDELRISDFQVVLRPA